MKNPYWSVCLPRCCCRYPRRRRTAENGRGGEDRRIRFNAMEAGIKSEGAKRGIDADGRADGGGSALQVRAIEDLTQKVDIIGVVPNDARVLAGARARRRRASR
ncbi:hypothetical protein M8494_26205 [Serratia ureilytica]